MGTFTSGLNSDCSASLSILPVASFGKLSRHLNDMHREVEICFYKMPVCSIKPDRA